LLRGIFCIVHTISFLFSPSDIGGEWLNIHTFAPRIDKAHNNEMKIKIIKFWHSLTFSSIQDRWLLSILFLSLILRFAGLMPNIIYSDEPHIQVYSYELVKNFLTHLDINPHTLKYGSWIFYYQALLALPVFLLGYIYNCLIHGFTSFDTFFEVMVQKQGELLLLVGRGGTAFLGVISVFIIYLIGKKLFNKKVGLWAALFLGISPMHVRESHYMTTDVFFVLTILIALLFLIFLINTRKKSWFLLAGIAIGISSTIRFFPIVILMYPVALIMVFEKKAKYVKNVLLGIIGIAIGTFLGVPFLFLDKNGPSLFAKDLLYYALPWYGTTISKRLLEPFLLLISSGTVRIPENFSFLYPAPDKFRPLYASWIFFKGIGPIPTILAIMGLVVVFRKSKMKLLLLLIAPFLYFIYISFMIPAIYEKLALPIIPFLAIFAAVAVAHLGERIKNKMSIGIVAPLLLIGILFLLGQFSSTLHASVACEATSIPRQSADWVDNNIPSEARVGYLTPVAISSTKKLGEWLPLEPKYELSMEEAKKKDLDYVFLNTSRLDYETYPYFNDYFVVPNDIFMNSYNFLVFAEYQSQGQLLYTLAKPMMCDPTRIYYYKLPTNTKPATNCYKNVNFSDNSDESFFSLQNYDENKAILKLENNSLVYKQDKIRLTPPRIISKLVPVTQEGSVYSFSFKAKKISDDKVTLIARLDFYDADGRNNSYISDLNLLLENGSTPVFFEKKRFSTNVFDDTSLPGRVVSLSSKEKLTNEWSELSVSATAPTKAKYVVLSIQNIETNEANFMIDDVKLFSSNKDEIH
jgi:hypothetical protein